MKSIIGIFRDPAFINFVQFVMYAMVAFCGLLAATGSLSTIMQFQIGSALSLFLGSLLIIAGTIGACAVFTAHWWLERIGIRIFWLGLFLLIVVTLGYAFNSAKSPTIWLIFALEILALGDAIKRYRRIDWAYLNPAK